MQGSVERASFCSVLDFSLTSLLTTFVGLDECVRLSRLNKMLNRFVFKAPEVSDFIWRKQFQYEFF